MNRTAIQNIFSISLIFLFSISMPALTACDRSESQANPAVDSSQTGGEAPRKTGNAEPKADKLIIYYFHGNYRCRSCKTIEAYTEEAVKTGFAEQLASGRIEWKPVNIDEPGNEHFAADYKLYTKSVILSDIKNGKETRWKNLDQVWQLLRDKTSFISYVQREVKAYLEG